MILAQAPSFLGRAYPCCLYYLAFPSSSCMHDIAVCFFHLAGLSPEKTSRLCRRLRPDHASFPRILGHDGRCWRGKDPWDALKRTHLMMCIVLGVQWKKFPLNITTVMSIAWRRDMERPSGRSLEPSPSNPSRPAWRPFHATPRVSSYCWHYCCDTWRELLIRRLVYL